MLSEMSVTQYKKKRTFFSFYLILYVTSPCRCSFKYYSTRILKRTYGGTKASYQIFIFLKYVSWKNFLHEPSKR